MNNESASEDHIRAFRRFNRTVTERIGALNDDYLARRRPLGASRLLWQIGDRNVDVKDVRTELNLDSGYVSRLLRSLEADDLVDVQVAATDSRARTVALTPSGKKEQALLDHDSDEMASSILTTLHPDQRSKLIDAMTTVERLLTASLVEFHIEDPASPDATFCLDRYFEELDGRFDAGFDPTTSISADVDELTEPAGLLIVARLHGRPVGCGALKLHGDEPAEIKRMWVGPDARGLGLGRRLLLELENRATGYRATSVRLETNASLTEAINLYRSTGYVEVAAFNDEPFAHHWFEKALP